MSLKEQLENLQQKSLQEIQRVVDLEALNQIRVEVLGKKKDRLQKFYAACVI